MDFKKFGTVILVLGMLVFSYGGFQWISNQPKKFNLAESQQTIFGGRDDLGNMLNVQTTNLVRAGKRESSVKVMITGGIVAFVGIGMILSAKKNSYNHLIVRRRAAEKKGGKNDKFYLSIRCYHNNNLFFCALVQISKHDYSF